MENGEGYNGTTRRNFLKGIVAALLLVPIVQSCRNTVAKAIVKLTGTRYVLGHRLWAKDFPKPVKTISVPYLIVGGGITGLSAARQLTKKGITDFLLLELEDHTGGNSSSGENKYSKFPLGAHYLPLPNFHDKELLSFLEEENVITGYGTNGLPVFDEDQLNFAPHERLFYKNSWQEGLVPRYGNSAEANIEFSRFFKVMDDFRTAKGSDGNYHFDIPVSAISTDVTYRNLDGIAMKKWLHDNDFVTDEVHEYVNYCCRDDFGLGIDYVSAWAGIHYFAARKHNSTTDDNDNVLTWPEGNARLAGHLQKYVKGKVLTNHIVFEVNPVNGKAVVKVYDASADESTAIVADKVIMATPQFVNQYLLPGRKEFTKQFQYAPWLLATLTVNELYDDGSYPLCWDNVIYKGNGLGYIYDQHQQVNQLQPKKVITYYHSFSSDNLKKIRKEMYRQPKEYWEAFVMDDLKKAHPDIESVTEEITIHRLGHGMVSPVPGAIFGDAKQKAAQSIDNCIYFAHSDLSGISVFEEAFHQGIAVVNRIMQ